MSKKDEALKLALEALEHMCMHTRAKVGYRNKLIGEAMDKAREALADQPAQQQEPYGWKVYGVNSLFMGEFAEADAKAEAKRIGGTCITFPLYTSPPARSDYRDWDYQYLVDEYRKGFIDGQIDMRDRPEEQQEPVAWVQPNGELVVRADYGGRLYYSEQNLYASQPASKPWVGLTEEEINEVLGGDIRDEPSGELEFVRAIEAKLREKNT